MKFMSWSTWLAATILILLYVWAGSVASKTEVIHLTLEPGYSTQVRLFRLADDRLRMRLVFEGDRPNRGELGRYSTRSDWRTTGVLKFDDPGSAVRLIASIPDAAPVTYEAMPKSGSWNSKVERDLTAGHSLSRGEWEWPPANKGLELRSGTNIVSIKVAAVEAPLVGEDVELWVRPALGFKAGMENVLWLWGWFLWPVLLLVQMFWAVLLGRRRGYFGAQR
jgi:hypothetical protein